MEKRQNSIKDLLGVWGSSIFTAILITINCFPVFSQCTSCSTCSATFCDITVSADNTTDYTLSGNFAEDKMCITAGTYSGDITINGSTPTICVTGGTFAPATFTNASSYNFYLYVNSGAAATFPGNTTFTNNWYNNGTVTVNGNLTTSGGFPDNCGSLTVNGDFTITTSFDNCSGGTILVTGDLKNDGTFNINGNVTVRDSFINTGQITGYDGVTITTKHFLNGTGSNAGQIQGPGTGTFCFNISDYSKNSSDGQIQGNVGLCDITPPGGCSEPECIDANEGSLAASVTNCSGSCDGSTLPVELVYFAARAANGGVLLTWITASEINNDYFIIQKSADATHFYNIGIVKGHGNSSENIDYVYYDEEPSSANIFYYRLKQVDYDGKYTVSFPVAAVTKEKDPAITRLFSPAGDILELDLYSTAGEKITTEVTDALGTIIFSAEGFASKGVSQHYLGLPGLANGVYLIRVVSERFTLTKRFMKR